VTRSFYTVVDCHWLPFFRSLRTNLAALAVIFCLNDSVARGYQKFSCTRTMHVMVMASAVGCRCFSLNEQNVQTDTTRCVGIGVGARVRCHACGGARCCAHMRSGEHELSGVEGQACIRRRPCHHDSPRHCCRRNSGTYTARAPPRAAVSFAAALRLAARLAARLVVWTTAIDRPCADVVFSRGRHELVSARA
jgi:hypothetical protein